MSCLQISLAELGIPVAKYFASEIDKHAMQFTQTAFKDTIQIGGIEFVTKETINHEIELLAGGSPCQGFSFTGKRLNFKDPRSKLFFEFERLKKELNLKYFLFENVTMKKIHEDVITNCLGVEPIKINSNIVSAQNRKRIYWTNIPNLAPLGSLNIDLKDILEDLPNCPIGIKVREKSNCVRVGGRNSPFGSKQIWDSPFQKITKKGKVKSGENHSDTNIANTPWTTHRYSVTECARLQTVPEKYIKTMLSCGISDSQLYKMLGNGWTINVIKYFLQGLSRDENGTAEGKTEADLRATMLITAL